MLNRLPLIHFVSTQLPNPCGLSTDLVPADWIPQEDKVRGRKPGVLLAVSWTAGRDGLGVPSHGHIPPVHSLITNN